jgi:hypothetical protein
MPQNGNRSKIITNVTSVSKKRGNSRTYPSADSSATVPTSPTRKSLAVEAAPARPSRGAGVAMMRGLDTLYCAERVEAGKSYCARNCAIVYRAGTRMSEAQIKLLVAA